MAAPARKMVGVSDDSSSSDDEVLKRCQEAVWETRADEKKDGDSNVTQSKRFVVADHEHDGNELQVTQGFRTHVAKKLGHLLDSSIAEMCTETVSCVESAKCDDDDHEGFRLLSTSVPGQPADDPPAPVRRRPLPSSSDSDSEMETRLREAAVSVKDLLSESLPLSALYTPSAEKLKRKVAEGEESHVVKKKKKKKKKKKRKANQEGGEQVDSAGGPHNAQRNGEHGISEQEHTQVKVKRKKKQRKLHTEEEALN
ncbi:protein CUSTOS [Anarrhichthys ocellatus]|uniref:protein CUSTOS n=1 Tax=Anarrhichthys ocellatus TaxID=433405 RepID=UPI0012EE5AB6|nr:protein CUSTOS [Anarrhichthys ocellatus]